ncbi:MAG: hypothetical protein PUC65_01875 [Clostridiales bacterium]|nr:hypothetical protein [Clostridiales bacterium]
MKMNEEIHKEDEFMNESDEFLLHMTEQLNDELSDITVSEDLIAKTLKAVRSEDKKTESVISFRDAKASIEDNTIKDQHRRNYAKLLTSIAGVAAACFVIIIGAKVIGGGRSMYEENCKSTESAYDRKDEENVMSGVTLEAPSDKGFNEMAEESAQGATSMEDVETEESSNVQESDKTEPALNNPITAGKDKQTEHTLFATPPILEDKTAFAKALDAAKAENLDMTYIHTYRGNSDELSKLLKLFSSDELRLCSEEPTDEWSDFVVLSADDDTAILYKVGKKEYVVAQTYEVTGLKSETIYQVKDMDAFMEELDAVIGH